MEPDMCDLQHGENHSEVKVKEIWLFLDHDIMTWWWSTLIIRWNGGKESLWGWHLHKI